MKIYFTYRDGYTPGNRVTRVFEAGSIIEWFVSNWEHLNDTPEKAEALLGFRPYGFPFSDSETEEPVSAPGDMDELLEYIENYTYSNDVEGDAHHITVQTDDDEIELVWMVFDETYAHENPEQTAIWLEPALSQTYTDAPVVPPLRATPVFPSGTGEGMIYFGFSTIYDGDNIGGLEGLFAIRDVRVPELESYFRNAKTVTDEDASTFGNSELAFLQRMAQLHPELNGEALFREIAKYPLNVITESSDPEEIAELDAETLEEMELGNDPEKCSVRYSPHLVELNTNNVDVFYNYVVIFDDLWLNANPQLGKSVARFFNAPDPE